jgi:hypothetical protein
MDGALEKTHVILSTNSCSLFTNHNTSTTRLDQPHLVSWYRYSKAKRRVGNAQCSSLASACPGGITYRDSIEIDERLLGRRTDTIIRGMQLDVHEILSQQSEQTNVLLTR